VPETIKYYIIGFVIAFLVLGLFIILLAILYSRKQIKNRNEKLEMQAQFSETLLQSQLEIQEQTLQNISNELHDNLGQIASLIKINLHTVPLDNVEKAAQKLADTRELTKQLINDIKSLSRSLSSDRIAQIGLSNALQAEVERINRTEQFIAAFECAQNIPAIGNDKATILFRMAQEVLNNMVKHSEAKNIKVSLASTENLIILAVSDNGKGFDVADKLKHGGGAGLRNLQKRAALIKATLTMESNPGKGTFVKIEVPCNYAPDIQSEISPRR